MKGQYQDIQMIKNGPVMVQNCVKRFTQDPKELVKITYSRIFYFIYP